MSARWMTATGVAVMTMMGASTVAAADLDYPDDYSHGGKYWDGDRRYGARSFGDCVPRFVIRRRLRDEGWRHIERVDARGSKLYFQAERPNGRVFDIKVDRCDGHILDTRRAHGEVYGEYRGRKHRRHYYD